MSLRGRRARWIAVAALIVVAAVVVTVVVTRSGDTATAAPSTSKVTRGDVSLTVSAAGTVQAQASRTLGFSQTGTVTELDVKAGDVVTAGQVLAKIDASSAQGAVDSATQAVTSAQDAVDTATAELNATPSPCPSTPTSRTTSPSTRTSSPSNRPSASAGVNAAPAALAAPAPAASSKSCGSQQNRSGGSSSGTDALLSAQQRLNNAELTLQQAQTKLDGTTITAPIGGKVLSVAGSIGAPGGSNFLVLAGTNDVVVRAQFTEAEVANLAVKQAAKITLSDQGNTTYTGSVIQIDPAGTISSRLVRYGALIAFDNLPAGLLYGQSANVAVTTKSVTNVRYVPSTAISDRKGTTGTVSVLVGGHTEKRTVQLGLRGDVDTEVRSGLAEGDEVLTSAVT
jgi:multidrug efflux pump subunit AcrA (membrane-fusion protein)